MDIQRLTSVDELHELQQKHFPDLDFPDFVNHFMYVFEVRDQQDRLITGGGIKLVPEIMVFTDLDMKVIDRTIALKTVLNFSIHTMRKHGFEEILAFAHTEKYSKRLMRTGFNPAQGIALVLEI